MVTRPMTYEVPTIPQPLSWSTTLLMCTQAVPPVCGDMLQDIFAKVIPTGDSPPGSHLRTLGKNVRILCLYHLASMTEEHFVFQLS